ncbi:hypothetical protein PHLCEN_2v4164 [Hermanssonia centrifuga]|uniref:DUF6533 domain-containing protein n=1 Tax=Hermanssonia centrifuga TaxID=98765 RepID=A0A2R6PZ25_9APHY|nr:hypothetical protein PHLCEN_2v4164 [Hermanssonia centrifuga]
MSGSGNDTTPDIGTPEDIEAFIEFATLNIAANYDITILFVVVLYDYILTVKTEVNYVWHQKFSGATVIFFVNRYFKFAAAVIFMFEAMAAETPKVPSLSSMSYIQS